MSIIGASWSNAKPTILEDLQKVREQTLKTGYLPIQGSYTANFGGMDLGTILAAVEYGRQLDAKEKAKETRRLKKRHKRKLLSKQRQ